MQILPKVGALCSIYSSLVLGFGGIASAALGTTLKNTFKTIKVVDRRSRVYKWKCYKWAVNRGSQKGDVAFCPDKRVDQDYFSVAPGIFVLWLLKGNPGVTVETGLFYEVEKLQQISTGKEITFTTVKDLSVVTNASEKRLDQPTGLRRAPLDLSKINGKPLKDGKCKIESSNQLHCEAYQFKVTAEEVDWWFKLTYE